MHPEWPLPLVTGSLASEVLFFGVVKGGGSRLVTPLVGEIAGPEKVSQKLLPSTWKISHLFLSAGWLYADC